MKIKTTFLHIVILLIAVLLLAGCPSKETVKNVTGVIDAFDGVNIYTLDLEKIVGIGKPAVPVLAEMLSSTDKPTRWAAVMSLSAIGHELSVPFLVLPDLKKACGDEDISVRVTAAELVLSFGNESELPVLITALVSDQIMQPSEPPTPVYTQAMSALMTYTTQSFSKKKDWQAWWDKNKGQLTWSGEDEKFK
jgi:hypothetical protein